jgi:endonuclease G, mitochondrial
MKTLVLPLLLSLGFATAALAWDQKPNKPISACAEQLPYGVPASNRPNTLLKCNTAYAVLHDNTAKVPIWVAYTLTPKHAIGCVARTNAFVADASLPKGQRAELTDYAKSGYDQGHLAPDGDMSWDQQVEYESFLMSNMSPQLPNLNRGVWKYLETSVRSWAYGNNRSYTVYAGNIYTPGQSKTIGASAVVVPDYLYKIVIDNATGQSLAFMFPQVASQPIDLQARLVSISAIENAIGVAFPVPQGTNKAAVGPAVWPVDFKKTADAKKAQCKGAPGTDD